MANKTSTNSPYHYQTRIVFDECDPAGILFFGHIFSLAHRAFENFVESVGIAYKDWFASESWAVPIRHAEVEFLNPLRLGDTATALVRLKKIGRSSLVVGYSFHTGTQLAAEVETVHVFIDRATGKARTIPEPFAVQLKSVLPDQEPVDRPDADSVRRG